MDAISEKNHGLNDDDINPVLDFGCGSGRVLRFWKKHQQVEVFGTDYNPSLIEWCRRNLPFATVSTNDADGPLEYEDSKFGLVYAISVFTHLSLEKQRYWLNELVRVTRRGGHLIITVHGRERTAVLSRQQREDFQAGKIVTRENRYGNTNICGAYQPRGSLERLVLPGREIDTIDHIEMGATDAAQDIYLFRKR